MNINFYFLLEVVVKDKISKECKNLFKIASKGSETMSTLSFIVKDFNFFYLHYSHIKLFFISTLIVIYRKKVLTI